LRILQHLRQLASTGESGRDWLEKTIDAPTLREETISLVEGELHGQLWQLARWRRAPRDLRPGFELALFPNSLWSALWYLFALDTQSGTGWRICPDHKRLFYPPRKDRFYCTTEEQQLHSKLAWWQNHKETELEKRRAARRKLSTHSRTRGAKK
jgi:hypothetical protein